MKDKQKILAEIERLYCEEAEKYDTSQEIGAKRILDELSKFINSLPAEQPSEDLEEAANLYANKQGLELKPFARRFFIAGAQWQKEQMMKGFCFETKVYQDCDGDDVESPFQTWLSLEQNEITALPSLGLSDGDKVKVIIVKED